MAEDMDVKDQDQAISEPPGEGDAAALAEEGLAEVEGLRDSLAAAEARAAEYLDGWQRAQAEFSNYKKRQETERAQMMMMATAGLVSKLLPVADDFERAIVTLPACLDRLTWVDGFLLIKHKLDAVLQSEGVKPMDTQGKSFDPRFHEAITYEVADGFEEGQIIGEVQAGYTVGDRVLRPALVRVAKAPAPVDQADAIESPAIEGSADA